MGLGGPELIMIGVVVLLLFGGKKLPELMRGLGKGIKEFKNAKDSFLYNTLVHFGYPMFTVLKNNGHFYNFKTQLPGCKFHFYLKGVTEKMNFLKVYGFEHIAGVTYKSCSSILYWHPGNQPRV